MGSTKNTTKKSPVKAIHHGLTTPAETVVIPLRLRIIGLPEKDPTLTHREPVPV
jgi:hypothetical protein